MVFLTQKKIKGKKYTYIAKSIRLGNGCVKTMRKLIKKDDEKHGIKVLEKKYAEFFLEKEIELNAKHASKTFRAGYIFSKNEMEKLEKIKVEYRLLFKKLGKEQINDVFDRFTVNFTFNSNAIEGNSLTLKDVRVIIYDNSSVKGKNLIEIFETRNSRKVADLILRKRFRVSHKDIIKIHSMLMQDIDSRVGYKKLPNVIITSGREIRTTPPERVYQRMDELINWYNTNAKKLHPLELATLFHGKFEKIHPFEDGNGRVGRFLINIILVNSGYPPIIIRKTVRESYMGALMAFDNGYEDRLKRFMVEKFKETFLKFFEIYVKYASQD